jgi:hypothetical protein
MMTQTSLHEPIVFYPLINTAFTILQRKSHLCIPFLGNARPQSQFPHTCVCEQFTTNSQRTANGLGSNLLARGGLSSLSHRSLCSQVTTTGEELAETAAEVVAEAGGLGEARAEAEATTRPIRRSSFDCVFFFLI